MTRLIKLNISGFFLLSLAACGGGGDQGTAFDEQPLPEPDPEQIVLVDPGLDDDLLIIDEDEPPLESDFGASPVVLYFDFDKTTLKDDGIIALEDSMDALVNSTGIIRLEGHADERGTKEYNLALGERRAASVRDYLAAQGVPSERIETNTFGEEVPVAYGQNEEAWSQNRRVELKLD